MGEWLCLMELLLKIDVPNEILFSKSVFSHAEVYDKFVIGTALQQAEVFLWL